MESSTETPTDDKTSATLYLAIALCSLFLGLLIGSLYSTKRVKPPKADEPLAAAKDSAKANAPSSAKKAPVPPVVSKAASPAPKSSTLQNIFGKVLGSTPPPPTAEASTSKVDSKSLRSLRRTQSECINTVYDVDEFMTRLYKTGFIVRRIKGEEAKTRCMKVDKNGHLCFFKKFKGSEMIVPVGSPYITLEFADLRDCFLCEDRGSFILEFTQKTFLLQCDTGVDSHYLVEGFKHVMDTLKIEKSYISQCVNRYKDPAALSSPTKPISPMKGRKHHSSDDSTIVTTHSGTSYTFTPKKGGY